MPDFDEERKRLLILKRAVNLMEESIANLKHYIYQVEENLIDKEEAMYSQLKYEQYRH